MAQNFTSVAGEMPTAAMAGTSMGCAALALLLASLPDDTAFSRPLCTVDFSACVALLVRR